MRSARTGQHRARDDERRLGPDEIDEHRRERPRRGRASRCSRPSSAPSARPSTASGTARCMIVSALTSTIELPIPSTPSATTAITANGSPPRTSERQPEEREPDGEVPRQPSPRREDERDEAADEPADADGGVEEPDTRRVEVEQLERRDDDEHVERARDERLRRIEADERPEVGSRAIVAIPARMPARPRLGVAGGARRPLARRARDRGARRRGAADQRNVAPFAAKTTAGSLTASRRPPSAGPRNVPTLSIVLEATFAAVSSAGERDERRQERRLRRPEDRAGDRRQGDERVDDRRRPVGGDHARPRRSSARSGRRRSRSSTSTREKRSTSVAANGATIAAGTSRISPTRPTAPAPPCSYA